MYDYFILYDCWRGLHTFSGFVYPERLVSPDSDSQKDHYDNCLGRSGSLYPDPDLITVKKESATKKDRLPKPKDLKRNKQK